VTKEEIISEMYTSKELRDYCLKVCKDKYMADDLLSYSFEQLLLKDDKFITEKYSDKTLNNYFAGIVYKSFNFPTSAFYKQYIAWQHTQIIIDDIVFDETNVDSVDSLVNERDVEREILIYEKRSEKCWYEASVFRLYLKYGNLRDLSMAISIPVTSLSHSINNIKKYLSKKICEKYY